MIPKDCPSLGPSDENIPRGEWTANKEAQRVGRANQRFAEAPAWKKRVTLAKDVLQWLAAQKLVAAGGPNEGSVYLTLPDVGIHDTAEALVESDGKVNGHKCKACAIGSLVAVAAERDACRLDANIAVPFRGDPRGEIFAALSGFFDPGQLSLMEWAYEGGLGLSYVDSGLTNEEKERAVEFAFRHPGRTERLAAIMSNIVANRGTFVV